MAPGPAGVASSSEEMPIGRNSSRIGPNALFNGVSPMTQPVDDARRDAVSIGTSSPYNGQVTTTDALVGEPTTTATGWAVSLAIEAAAGTLGSAVSRASDCAAFGVVLKTFETAGVK